MEITFYTHADRCCATESRLCVRAEWDQSWPAVHRLDVATLFSSWWKAIFRAGLGFHGVAEEGVPFKSIAEMIGQRLNVPVVSQRPEQAAEHFAFFAHFVSMDAPASSKATRDRLGWQPKQPGLIADLEGGSYFRA